MNLHPPFGKRRPRSWVELDSANYQATFDRALGLVEYDQLESSSATRGSGATRAARDRPVDLHRDVRPAPSNILGVLRYVAGAGTAPDRVPADRAGVVKTGTSPHGQGHETTWSQIVADELGVTPDDIEVLHGDMPITPLGMDTYGSRSVSVGGAALHLAVEKVKAKARTIAAHELEVAEDDLEWSEGSFT